MSYKAFLVSVLLTLTLPVSLGEWEPLVDGPFRWQHTAFLHNNFMYIFGGSDGASVTDTLYLYDVEGKSVTELCFLKPRLTATVGNNWTSEETNGEGPEPRGRHSSVIWRNKTYIYGGENKARPQIFGDIFSLDLNTKSWVNHTRGPLLSSHSAVVTHFGEMVIFGGIITEESNAVHTFIFETEEWDSPATTGPVPEARKLHSAVYAKGLMWIFGGKHGSKTLGDLRIFDPDYNIWFEATTPVVGPAPRSGHAAVVSPDGQFMLVFGGNSATGVFLSDTWKYDFNIGEWEVLNLQTKPPERIGHTACLLNQEAVLSMLIFGGGLLTEVLNSTYVLRLELEDSDPLRYANVTSSISVPSPTLGAPDVTFPSLIAFDGQSPSYRILPIDACKRELVLDSFMKFRFMSLTEVAPNNAKVRKALFPNNNFRLDKYHGIVQRFNWSYQDFGITLQVNFSIFGQEEVVEYQGVGYMVPPGTVKWSLGLTGWPFLDLQNRLELEMVVDVVPHEQLEVVAVEAPNQELQGYHVSSDHLDTWITLANFAVMDDSKTTITHSLQADKILFSFPAFTKALFYDPDFNVLLGRNGGKKGVWECGSKEEKDEDSTQLPLLLVAITVPVVVFLALVVGGVLLWLSIKRKQNNKRRLAAIQKRMKEVQQSDMLKVKDNELYEAP